MYCKEHTHFSFHSFLLTVPVPVSSLPIRLSQESQSDIYHHSSRVDLIARIWVDKSVYSDKKQ